jgi:iron complex transport system ATP-binding protein
MTARAALAAEDVVLGYSRSTVVHGVTIRMRPSAVTTLVGPNGSGKSTVLRSLARLHAVQSGRIRVGDGHGGLSDAAPLSSREFARRVTLLSQSRPHASGLDVRDVVAFGRHPHRRRLAPLTDADRTAIDRALDITGVAPMASRPVDQLSGGELQRVWLATCLAQDTAVLLLDEPTNHLDLRYQVEILDLIRELADTHGTALGVVLHDLTHAAAVADDVVLLCNGRVAAAGLPQDVLTSEHLTPAYGLPIDTSVDPGTGLVRVEPRATRRRRSTASSNA